jgi:hypothetical protein
MVIPRGTRTMHVWMGVDKDVFYDESHIAIIPMGYQGHSVVYRG